MSFIHSCFKILRNICKSVNLRLNINVFFKWFLNYGFSYYIMKPLNSILSWKTKYNLDGKMDVDGTQLNEQKFQSRISKSLRVKLI
jgi:hypothetical protein